MVLLRNINLSSRSECQFALELMGRISDTCIHDDVEPYGTFLGDRGRGGQHSGPLECVSLRRKVHKQVLNAAWLATLRKANKSAHHRSQESDRRRKSSKLESTYWRFFTSQVLRLTLHDTVVLY